MAEKVLFSIATGITQILGSMAKEELVLLLGVEDELEKLKNTVSTIEAVLLDAEKQQQGSHAVKTWLAQLEDILYDADDLLDDISTEALQRKVMKDKKGRKTLKLLKCDALEELPRNIKVLVNLRHLDLWGCRSLKHMPHGLSRLTNLQTLSRFVVDSRELFRRGGGLNELKELNNLRGQLSIQNLRHGKDQVSKYKDANLKEKSHLHTLELCWGGEGDIDDIVGNEMLIEGLQPQLHLKKLLIEGYWGSRLPRWLWSLTNLVILNLRCPRCQYLPPLSRLPRLKDLTLRRLEVMKDLSDCSDRGDIYELPSSSSSSVPFFPSLENLYLMRCENVEWCWLRRDSYGGFNNDDDDSVEKVSMTESLLLPSFPRLSSLSIFNCPRLTSMPIFPHLGFLELEGNLKLLNQMSRMNISTTIVSSTLATSSSICLPKLKTLILSSIQELENLQGELLQNLVSLEILGINYSHNLKSLFGIQYLIAVKDLRIHGCSGFGIAEVEDWMQGPCFKNLLFLEFSYLPKLASLPLCLQHATTLQKLTIHGCKRLTAIPEWFPSCTGSLQSLNIYNCPILMERCKREKGEDWPKIAHIPNLWIEEVNQIFSFFENRTKYNENIFLGGYSKLQGETGES